MKKSEEWKIFRSFKKMYIRWAELNVLLLRKRNAFVERIRIFSFSIAISNFRQFFIHFISLIQLLLFYTQITKVAAWNLNWVETTRLTTHNNKMGGLNFYGLYSYFLFFLLLLLICCCCVRFFLHFLLIA